MDTRHVVHVRHSADQLCEDLLNLFRRYWAMAEQIIVQFISWKPVQRPSCTHLESHHTRAILQDKPDQSFRHDNLIQSCDMRMKELPMMVDFSREIRVVLLRGFEDDLLEHQRFGRAKEQIGVVGVLSSHS